VSPDEDVLDDVVGVVGRAPQQRPRVATQSSAMAVVDPPEGVLVTGGDAAGELGVILAGAGGIGAMRLRRS
jgi:hypothetical protein